MRHDRDNDIGHKIWIKKLNIIFTLILIFVGSSASNINLDTKAAKRGKVKQNKQNGTPLAEIQTGEGTSHIDSEIYIVPLPYYPLCPLPSDCIFRCMLVYILLRRKGGRVTNVLCCKQDVDVWLPLYYN